ncbi:MAG: FtsX-like permease family protein, partial [Gemmatimonadetes bacterium]|nr:FtsX-like permease family protein [Gemmatimonadota bacterium]
DVLDGVRGIPGVEAAGAVTSLPLTVVPPYYRVTVEVEGDAVRRQTPPEVSFRFFTPGYLDAMGIPLLEGRRVAAGAAPDAQPVLLSAALARRLFPGGGAVGGRVRRSGDADARWSTVVGVVGDVRQESLTAGNAEVLYVPALERPVFLDYGPGYLSLVLRATVPPFSLTPAVRRAVLDVDPAMPIANVRTMERILAASTARTRLTMVLLLLASGVALFLGAVGIYGVVSYAVGRRTRELGVRLALGARPGQVTRLVVGEGALVIGAGVLGGLFAAWWLTRFLRGLLFEVSPTDPVTFVSMAAVLAAAGLLASWLPVRRVTRADLLATLKEP